MVKNTVFMFFFHKNLQLTQNGERLPPPKKNKVKDDRYLDTPKYPQNFWGGYFNHNNGKSRMLMVFTREIAIPF